ncbi:hypothetical protein [Streptomyces thioluteus]|uniref:hypothetical protein n=1 Tax=Streptomyces thioluteus TaxID=66431 RepID=UPI003CD06273
MVPPPRRVIADSLQSEQRPQCGFFRQGQTATCLVETDEDVPRYEDFRWLDRLSRSMGPLALALLDILVLSTTLDRAPFRRALAS